MSDRAAKRARRAKRKAKETEPLRRPRRVCADCGTALTSRTAIELGELDGRSRDYCKACFPPERDVEEIDTGGRT
jgi:hypothetical protein